jgi:hypothetical protein
MLVVHLPFVGNRTAVLHSLLLGHLVGVEGQHKVVQEEQVGEQIFLPVLMFFITDIILLQHPQVI